MQTLLHPGVRDFSEITTVRVKYTGGRGQTLFRKQQITILNAKFHARYAVESSSFLPLFYPDCLARRPSSSSTSTRPDLPHRHRAHPTVFPSFPIEFYRLFFPPPPSPPSYFFSIIIITASGTSPLAPNHRTLFPLVLSASSKLLQVLNVTLYFTSSYAVCTVSRAYLVNSFRIFF